MKKKCGPKHKYFIEDILDRCDFELRRLKNTRSLNFKSKYNKHRSAGYDPSTNENAYYGFRHKQSRSSFYIGEYEDWVKAFDDFSKKKVNIYGKKVDRSKVFDDRDQGYKDFKFGVSAAN